MSFVFQELFSKKDLQQRKPQSKMTGSSEYCHCSEWLKYFLSSSSAGLCFFFLVFPFIFLYKSHFLFIFFSFTSNSFYVSTWPMTNSSFYRVLFWVSQKADPMAEGIYSITKGSMSEQERREAKKEEDWRWGRICFPADATKCVECWQIHGNKPPRSWINCLATNLRVEGRNTHWLDPISGCSEFHPMWPCISGGARMNVCGSPREVNNEAVVFWGGCFWEASQSSCRAGHHRSSGTGAEDSWSLEHMRCHLPRVQCTWQLLAIYC